jgi:competence protein ComEA
MAQRHTARRFGLLARYLSQQETIVVPVTSPLNISSDKVTTQTDTVHTGLNIRNLLANRTKPTTIDLTGYQAISTTSHPVLDRAIPTTPYPLLSRTISTTPYPLLDQTLHMVPDTEKDQVPFPLTYSKKSYIFRLIAAIIVLASSLALYFIWHPASSVSSVPVVTPQNDGVTVSKISASKSGTPTNLTAGDIQVYIIGAVQHPGIYTLPASARVYQLLQAAGGPSSNANLIALNLAAKLNDGQEVYVTAIGESAPPTLNSLSSLSLTPSSASSQNPSLVNINTASANELSQQLKVSSKTAQAIVSYRQQHGAYTSVDQLLQVVSKSIYDKIKNNVTV